MDKLLAILVAALLIGSAPAHALTQVAAEQDAARFIESLGRDVIKVTTGDALDSEQRDSALHKLLHRGLDLRAIGRDVLDRFWNEATPAQLEEYHALFANYVVHLTSRMLKAMSMKEFQVTSAVATGEQDVLVETEVELLFGLPVAWDWRLRQSDHGFRIVDMTSNGVSLAAMMRSEIGSVVASRGVEALLDTLRTQMARNAAMRTTAAGPAPYGVDTAPAIAN